MIQRIRREPWMWTLVGVLLAIALAGLLAPVLPIPNPNQQDLSARLTPPAFQSGGTWSHVLGTDQLGRDILARLLAGTRLTLLIAFTAVLFGAILGSAVGLVAGYMGGAVDAVVSRIVDAQLALPFILLAISFVNARGRSVTTLIASLVVVSWAFYSRQVRAETQVLRSSAFVVGLRTAGISTPSIIIRHILPNVGGTIVVIGTLQIGTMILGESALSFLGLGVVSPDVSWGAMLAEGREHLRDSWWVVGFPGLAITVLVLVINLLGDSLRAAYDPRKRVY